MLIGFSELAVFFTAIASAVLTFCAVAGRRFQVEFYRVTGATGSSDQEG